MKSPWRYVLQAGSVMPMMLANMTPIRVEGRPKSYTKPVLPRTSAHEVHRTRSRYTGAMLRKIRARNGVGRPPIKKPEGC